MDNNSKDYVKLAKLLKELHELLAKLKIEYIAIKTSKKIIAYV